MPCRLADLMMQFLTYFLRFRASASLNFMPLASALHAAVAFSRTTLSAWGIFAASAGLGANAMPLTSTVATMPAIKVVAKRYMMPSFNRDFPDEANINLCVFPAVLQDSVSRVAGEPCGGRISASSQ